ncbi:MAG: 30S ribosomal protein S7 [Streptococcus salivarius]|nr:30S ribosomal protein S7 [Streptococcus salivarius]
MSRKNRAPKREVLADPLYNSKIVTRLINRVMLDGKRGTAATIVYDAFEQIKEATGNDALEVFETAMDNIMPVLEVRARRVGGSNYQVPVEVQIMDAANNTGASVKKREDTHKMAEANRAFAHFRW